MFSTRRYALTQTYTLAQSHSRYFTSQLQSFRKQPLSLTLPLNGTNLTSSPNPLQIIHSLSKLLIKHVKSPINRDLRYISTITTKHIQLPQNQPKSSTKTHFSSPFSQTRNKTNINTSCLKIQTRKMSRFTADEEKEHRELEKWGNNFQMHHIERSSLDFSFSRSSGPGGQNVNKVSSKAQVKFRLDDADWIHNLVKKKIKENYSRYLTLNNEFTMQSEVHRTQEQNCEECVKKIYELIKECSVVPKETSAEQKKKVQKMIDIQKKKDIEFKKKLKEKKSDRRGGRE